MKKHIFLFVISFMTLIPFVYSQNYINNVEYYNSGGEVYIENSNNDIKVDQSTVILKFENKSSTDIDNFIQTNNLTNVGEYVGYHLYELPNNVSYISFCQNLIQSPTVTYFEPSVYFTSSILPSSNITTDQYYLDLLNVYDAWKITTGDKSVVIAVLDSGLDFDTDDFGLGQDDTISNLYTNILEDEWSDWENPNSGNGNNDDSNGFLLREWNYDSITWDTTFYPYIDDWLGVDVCPDEDSVDNDNDVRPVDGTDSQFVDNYDVRLHGTGVAGIIAAKSKNNEEIDGIAGGDISRNKAGVSILPVKISGYKSLANNYYQHKGGTSRYVLEGISYAAAQGADVINMSIGVFSSEDYFGSVESLIDSLYNGGNGPLFVASSGNDGTDIVSYPARWASVVAVGGSEQGDDHWDDADFGPDLELVAPSVDIPYIYAFRYGNDDYVNGTSFSSPMVCAAAALMLSINPELRSDTIRQILRRTAYRNPSYDWTYNANNFNVTHGWNEHLGFGRIDVLAALCASMPELPEITISSDEVWDMPKYSNHDIIIESGASLTINNDLSMDPTAKIIVKRGAKLFVNNARITNLACAAEAKWEGIYVYGNANESQQADGNGDYEQGYLELNNAIIENAETAISLFKDGAWSSSYHGGIVKAYDSKFNNNTKAVNFRPYKNMVEIGNDPAFEADNEAVFVNCEFDITADYFPGSMFYKHADIDDVRGIDFIMCDFKRSSTANTSDLCCGIAAYDGGVSVRDSRGVPSTFEGFYCGIQLNNNNALVNYDSYIKNSVFTNNSNGIKLNAMTNMVSIKGNTFHVGYNSADKLICSGSQAFGIYLNNSNTFVIEDNTFDKYSGAPSDGDYIGIEAYNTQTSADEIFRNTFSGLTHANHAENQNWSQTQGRDYGLEYYCNQHSSNNNDLFFTFQGDDNEDNSGVQKNQGNQYQSTGNTFTQNVSGYNLYDNTGGVYNDLEYFYNVANSTEIPFSYTSTTINPHPQILAAECSDGGNGTDIKGLTSSEKQGLENEYTTAASNYTAVETLLTSLEDGGNTPALKSEVSSSWPDDMWELRAELLGLSPYLTTEVLKTAAEKTEVLPESVLFEILSANPDELKKSELMDYLENKEQPLPAYMISILEQLSEGLSAKTAMKGDMSRYSREKNRAARQMLVGLSFDENFSFHDYRVWMGRLGGMKNDQNIVASFVQEENYTDALALANLIPDLYELNTEELAEHNYYMDMLDLNINLKQQNRHMLDLNSSEYEQLLYIADNSKGVAGVKAQGVLEHFYGEHYCDCVNTTVDNNKSASTPFTTGEFAEAMGLKISAEPNPATTWVAFDYELPIASEKAELIIKSIDGKQVAHFNLTGETGQKVWDTRSLKAGAYIYEFISGELKQSGKLIITK
ncbi:S8 family serine peptidase [Lentimicrobium sp. S6]|uniref:S8 family serine peptidase n=1 Tax=Lentimicrobium sp. S6 TaxID=2735872 RepID=UPI0015517744|nr:S8 family serine peptidase [Lentimicrobium sp. S6]NPD47837.1 S8 family serine peptidase [Lentimicrobium sp. S6]